jgi:stearoyl-CoA desaturase (delta-9 desaturase)
MSPHADTAAARAAATEAAKADGLPTDQPWCPNGEQKTYKWILNWPMIIYVTLAHFLAFLGLQALPQTMWQTNVWAVALWPLSGLGITAGVHRLWAHRSYHATLPLRFFLMLLNSIANQGSIFHWSRDHRCHHKFSDTDADPHNATRGYFFSHMGWLLVKKHNKVIEGGRKIPVDDLYEDSLVMFQKKTDPWFTLFMCFVFPALVAQYCWGESFYNGFVVAGALRYMIVLHNTWQVNSTAHKFGTRPYDPTILPAENLWVSFVAIGEGYHNWHHVFPYDYNASEKGWRGQLNFTSLFLDTCCVLGLASQTKTATSAWKMMQKKRQE